MIFHATLRRCHTRFAAAIIDAVSASLREAAMSCYADSAAMLTPVFRYALLDFRHIDAIRRWRARAAMSAML